MVLDSHILFGMFSNSLYIQIDFISIISLMKIVNLLTMPHFAAFVLLEHQNPGPSVQGSDPTIFELDGLLLDIILLYFVRHVSHFCFIKFFIILIYFQFYHFSTYNATLFSIFFACTPKTWSVSTFIPAK